MILWEKFQGGAQISYEQGGKGIAYVCRLEHIMISTTLSNAVRQPDTVMM